MIYFNTEEKKVFSYEAVSDNDLQWLNKSISEHTNDEWKFYLNGEPSSGAIAQIISEIEK
jgi:hypothetical protein